MSEPYLGEIRLVGFNFAPVGWAFCNGQLLSIAQNSPLYALIGTTYGGDGESTFGLPDLRGRIPMHQGTGQGGAAFIMGEISGAESVTLNANQIPSHNHLPQGNPNNGASGSPAGNVWASSTAKQFSSATPNATMNTGTVLSTGGGQPHENRMPILAVSFIIALQGIFPSRN